MLTLAHGVAFRLDTDAKSYTKGDKLKMKTEQTVLAFASFKTRLGSAIKSVGHEVEGEEINVSDLSDNPKEHEVVSVNGNLITLDVNVEDIVIAENDYDISLTVTKKFAKKDVDKIDDYFNGITNILMTDNSLGDEGVTYRLDIKEVDTIVVNAYSNSIKQVV